MSMGMNFISIQCVEPDQFNLYFYAYTNEKPPSEDLHCVDIRPWLYQRLYAIVEIQIYHKLSPILQPNFNDAGYAKTMISGLEDLDENILSELFFSQ